MNEEKIKKAWEIFEIVSNFIFVLMGAIGFSLTLLEIDYMVMNHFGWFVCMQIVFATVFTIGWKGLSNAEEDS